MFSKRKSVQQPDVDFSTSIERAIRNPLREQGSSDEDQHLILREILLSIEASFYVIDQVREILAEACQVVLRAKDVDDLGGRAMLAEQYDELRQSIMLVLTRLDSDAAKLLGSASQPMRVSLSPQSTYSVNPARLDLSEAGINLPPPTNGFASTAEIADTLAQLDYALGEIDNTSSYFIKDAKFLISKLER